MNYDTSARIIQKYSRGFLNKKFKNERKYYNI